MKIVLLSDTHESHREVSVPEGDMLIHAGDVTFFSRRPSMLKDFNDWLGEQPHRYKVVIPGNHDSLFLEATHRRMITNAKLIINEGTTLGGLRVWGSPVTPLFDAAFGMPGAEDRRKLWSRIPNGLDILITHCPPHGVLDSAPGEEHHNGCIQLREAVIRKRPLLHVFGHAHSAHGRRSTQHTQFLNVALPGEFGDLENEPFVVKMEPRESRVQPPNRESAYSTQPRSWRA